jgi:predicted dehydrogenase
MKKRKINVGELSREEIAKAARRPVSKSKKARLGFIGAGWWATTNHMPLLAARPDVEMVSVCGLDEKILKRCQKDFGFSHVTSDYRELLRQDLDGVVVASPHPMHFQHALAALKAGCHVMVEKPFTIHTREAKSLVSLARRKRLHIVVPYGFHHRPISTKAKEIVRKGELGKVEFVLCHMASQLKNLFSGKSFDFGGYTKTNLSTWSDPRIAQGGYGYGQLSHATGLMFWLTGLRPRSVYARMSHPGSHVDMYDAMSVRYEGGAVGTVSGAATLPPGTPGNFQLDIRIFGEKGMLHFDVAQNHLSVHTHRGKHKTIALRPGDAAYRCDGPPHQFVELILGLTRDNSSSGEIALRSVELLDAGYRSNRSGREERV